MCHSYYNVYRDNLRAAHRDNESDALEINSIVNEDCLFGDE